MKALVRDVGTLVEFAPTNWQSVDVSNLVKSSTLSGNSQAAVMRDRKKETPKIYNSQSVSTPVGSRVSLAVVCSFMYGLGISAIGIGFSVAHLLMSSSKIFDRNIYLGYTLFLFMGGVSLQGALVVRKIASLLEGIRVGRGLDSDVSYKAFGSVGFRLLIGVFGVVSAFWFLLEFSWNLDASRLGVQCYDRGMEITVFALAMMYTLLHLHVMFYNAKLLLKGFELITLLGLMHLVGTNVTTYCWALTHFIQMTQARHNSEELCDGGSVLTNIVLSCYPYLGAILLQFLLMSTALLLSVFLHYHGHGSFIVQSRLDEMVRAARHNLRLSTVGLVLVVILGCGTVVLVVYHYLLIHWGLNTTAWLIVELTSLTLAILSLGFNVALMVVNRYSPFDSLFRTVQMEGLLLTVGLVGALLYELFFLIGSAQLGGDELVAQWAVAASVVKMVDSMVQTTLLLQTLRVFATFLSGRKFLIQQSLSLHLSFSNFVFALMAFMRQGEEIYGRVYSMAFGFVFWSVVRFLFSSFAILFRLFSAVSYATIWLRSFEG